MHPTDWHRHMFVNTVFTCGDNGSPHEVAAPLLHSSGLVPRPVSWALVPTPIESSHERQRPRDALATNASRSTQLAELAPALVV